MSDDFQQDRPPQQVVIQQRGGCMGGGCLPGCLLAGGFLLVLAICSGVGIYYWASNLVASYTSETPVELPTVELPPEDLQALETRLESFKETVDAGEAPQEDLVLTADEINALISKEEELRGRVFVKIDQGQVSGDVSFPTDQIPGGKGRYFNGSVTLDVSMENGILIVTLASAEVNGDPVPDKVIEAMAKENLAKDLYKDPKNAELMRRVESVKVEDDKIILRMRRESDSDDSPTDASDRGDSSQQPDDDAPETPGVDADKEPLDAAEPAVEGDKATENEVQSV